MAFNIIDANMNDLRKASRAGRSRSKETQQLIDAINGLRPGTAKALVPEGSETVQKLRARLNYAARAAGVKIRVATDGKQVMFALRRGSSPSSRGDAAGRKAAVQERALRIGRRRSTITADDVLAELEKDGVALSVARPATMVGAVLRAMPEFERVGRNEFRLKR